MTDSGFSGVRDRVAILDLGTNTFHLLVVRMETGNRWFPVHRSRKTVKLGEGAIHEGFIAPIPFERGIRALTGLKERAERHGATQFVVAATSAVRSAANRREFLIKAFQTTGLRINVLSGKREAELIAKGVLQTLPPSTERVLIMDIGGGSVEFILADRGRIYWKQSFDIGAARLLESFRPSDPIRQRERQAIREFLEQQLTPLFDALQRFPARRLVSASGSAESFAKMIGYREEGKDPVRGKKLFRIGLNAYFRLHRDLMHATASERSAMKGLVQMRVDMIVPASLLTDFVLRKLKMEELFLSTFALKEGIAGALAEGRSI